MVRAAKYASQALGADVNAREFYMIFSWPIALLALLPWAALAAVLLWGKRRQVAVPFVELWRDELSPVRNRAARLPPAFVILVLLAALLAIIAAAGPAVRSSAGAGRIAILLDRGVTMSAQPGRIEQAIERARSIAEHAKAVQLIPIPGDGAIGTTPGEWPAVANAMPRTALNTRDLLRSTLRRRLAGDDDLVIVLSDQALPIESDRLMQIAPPHALANVGLTHIAAGNGQVMVSVRNQSDLTQGALSVNDQPSATASEIRRAPSPSSGTPGQGQGQGGGSASIANQKSQRPPPQPSPGVPGAGERASATREIELPPRGETRDYFLALPPGADLIHVALQVEDDLSADNEAWLVRQPAWPRIEARAPLPAELARMIDVYASHRPPADQAQRIVIARTPADLGDSPGVVVEVGAPQIGSPLVVVDHPIVANVRFGPTASIKPPPAEDGWTPLVFDEDHVYVAAREQPARQVRVNFDTSELAQRADFVVFWTNVFDFFAQGDGEFAGEPVKQLGGEWTPVNPAPGELWPGIYRRSDGALRAMNALDVRVDAPIDRKPAESRAGPAQTGARNISAWILVAALICLLAAALAWPRRRRGRSLFTPAQSRI